LLRDIRQHNLLLRRADEEEGEEKTIVFIVSANTCI